jgi:dTDP-4-amino-4,6-dideoxygalactose transaminase
LPWVRNDMINISEISIYRSTMLRDALAMLDRSASGVLLLIDTGGKFERTVTDGDLRRLILNGRGLLEDVSALPTKGSIVIQDSFARREALDLMNRNVINHLPVLNEAGEVVQVLERREIDAQILLSTPHMGDTEKEFVDEAFRTNWIAPLGPNVDAFERELADCVGVGHAAALTSGTAAIHLALRMLDVGPGDAVFCSTFTFAASANPIVYQGAVPIFIDSDRESWNMSAIALEKAFDAAVKQGRLPKAVVTVNLYGQSADMDALLAICDHYGVPLVEDAAESLGARYKGRSSGTFGHIGIYSFNGNKIITTSGGGMLVSNNQAFTDRARFLATQARDPAPHYQHSEIGYNYRMSNILAGVGRGQLKVLEKRVLARRAIHQYYRDALNDVACIEWMPEPAWSYSTHWLTACTIDAERLGITSTDVIKRLASEMIEARPLWKPMHLQPVFSGAPYFSHDGESVSDDLFARGLCLPSSSNLTPKDLDRVVQVLRATLQA